MTTAGGSIDEHPFLSGMERKGGEPRTIEQLDAEVARAGREVFSLHGMVEELKRAGTEVMSYLRGMKNERGPDPDIEGESDFERGVRMGSMFSGYREAPRTPRGNGNNAVMIGCAVAVISAFMLGAWQVAMRVTAVEVQIKSDSDRNREWQAATDRRLDRLESRP